MNDYTCIHDSSGELDMFQQSYPNLYLSMCLFGGCKVFLATNLDDRKMHFHRKLHPDAFVAGSQGASGIAGPEGFLLAR